MSNILIIILTAICSILIFSIVIFIHELGHFMAAKKFDVKVDEFAIGMGPAIMKKQKGETLYSVRAIPIGGYCKMEGEDEASEDERAFSRKKPWQRLIILVAGAFMNIVLGFLIVVISTISFTSEIPTNYVDSVTADMGAYEAGILSGDKMIKIDGVRVYTPTDLSLAMYKKDRINLTVLRNGEQLTFNVALSVQGGRYVIGVSRRLESKNFLNVITYSYFDSFSIIKMTYQTVFGMFNGQVSVNDMSGPVGIISTIGEAAKNGIADLLFIAMLISLNLGVMNLLPFPALDGGRIIFVLFEMITKKRPKPEIEGYIHLAGFAILIMFMLYVTKNDIVRLFIG